MTHDPTKLADDVEAVARELCMKPSQAVTLFQAAKALRRPTPPPDVAKLREALERLKRNFDLLLRGKPVRDVAETEAEVNAALAPQDAPSAPPSDEVERVARAIADELNKDDLSEGGWPEICRNCAVAAIAALQVKP